MKKGKPPKPATVPVVAPALLYEVRLSNTAQKQLDNLPDKPVQRITEALKELAHTPRPNGVTKLKGREGYRIRVGDYRVLYAIFDAVLLVEVVKVGQRGNFYDE